MSQILKTQIRRQSTLPEVQKRANSVVTGGYYVQGLIPTENMRLQQFLEVVFGSQLSIDQMKEETIKYLQVVETKYTEKIKNLQYQNEKLKKAMQVERI